MFDPSGAGNPEPSGRSRRPSEKGSEYRKTMKEQRRRTIYNQIKALRDDISQAITDGCPVEVVRRMHARWLTGYEELLDIHKEYQSLLGEEGKKRD